MLVEGQLIEVKWANSNVDHYIALGYEFTKYGDTFLVKAEDLSPGSKVLVEVECDYCGVHYFTPYHGYIQRLNKSIIKKTSCQKCVGYKCAETTLERRKEDYYNRVLKQCEINGYELLTPKDEMVSNTTYIEYRCPTHGVHKMRISNFLCGKKCPDCLADANRERFRIPEDALIKNIEDVGGELLNPEDYINNQTKNLIIRCPECGNGFITSYRSFIQHGGQLCPKCSSSSESLGERKVRLFLEAHNINFKQEHWFPDCRDINPLPFDFYLYDRSTIIEFDGSQHFYNNNDYFKNSKTTQMHDLIKNKYCEEHGIHLIRIPYWKIDKIELILSDELLIPHKDIV